MIFRKTQFFALVLLLSACQQHSGLEESVIIYDANKNALFISFLEEKDINFRVNDAGQIFYPVEQKETVIELFEKATGRKLQELQPPE